MDWQRVIWGRFSWGRLLRLPLIVYGGLLLVAVFLSDLLIFPYRGCSYTETLRGLEILEGHEGERLAITYQKAPQERYLALYFHGNAEDLGDVIAVTYELLQRGISVLAMDYPGYGLSTGAPTEESCISNAQRLYEHALSLGYTPDQLLIWGRSIGSGVGMGLADRVACRAVILDSPFKSAFTVRTQIPIVPFDKFPNLARVQQLQTPLFILHGSKDRTIPPAHSARLYEAHPGPKARYVIDGASHNDLWSFDLTAEWQALFEFIK